MNRIRKTWTKKKKKKGQKAHLERKLMVGHELGVNPNHNLIECMKANMNKIWPLTTQKTMEKKTLGVSKFNF